MKRTGILTFNRAINYGAALQVFALQETLESFGCDVKIINYISPELEEDHRIFSLKRCKSLRALAANLINIPFAFLRSKYFASFRKKYLKETAPSRSPAEFNGSFDLFIAGSDQVFNPQITRADKNYFLDFVEDKNKKFSYAASFGLDKISQEEAAFMTPLLNDFKKVSVRENQGAEIYKNLCGKDAEVDLDPVLLQTADFWQKTASNKLNGEKFILVYLIFNDQKLFAFAQELARKTGLKIKVISYSLRRPIKADYIMPSVNEWVEYFLKAEYIITNSFHGIAFSINFKKDFFADFLPSGYVNSRLEDILKMTGLTGRLIGNNPPLKISDWAYSYSVIAAEREKSLNYLKSITGNEQN